MILALAIVAGIQSVGVVMTTALMVTPAAAASLITRKLQGMFVWSAVISILSNCIGLYASFYLSVSSGGAIVLACTVLFGFIFVVTRFRGWQSESFPNISKVFLLPSVVVVRDKNLNGCEHLLINNGIACRRFSFAVSPQNPRKSLRRIAFHPYYRRLNCRSRRS